MLFGAVVLWFVWFPYATPTLKKRTSGRIGSWQELVQGHSGILFGGLAIILVLGVASSVRPSIRKYFGWSILTFGLLMNALTFKKIDASESPQMKPTSESTWEAQAAKSPEKWVGHHWELYSRLGATFAGATLVLEKNNFLIPWMAYSVGKIGELEYVASVPSLSKEDLEKLSSRYTVTPVKRGAVLFLFDPAVDPAGRRFVVVEVDEKRVIVPEEVVGGLPP